MNQYNNSSSERSQRGSGLAAPYAQSPFAIALMRSLPPNTLNGTQSRADYPVQYGIRCITIGALAFCKCFKWKVFTTERNGTERNGVKNNNLKETDLSSEANAKRRAPQLRVSVLICTYNRADILRTCLENMATITADKSLYEIVVINNNGTDNTNEVCQNFATAHPDITFRCVFEPKPGLWNARNRAVAAANYELLSMMDDDQTVLPNYVDAMIKAFEDYPEYSVVGARMFVVGEDGKAIKGFSRYLAPFANADFGDFAMEYPNKPSLRNPNNFYPSGGSITFRREVFERIGDYGERPNLKMAIEDWYIATKLWANNEKILYAPDVIIYHHIPKERYEYNALKKLAFTVAKSQAEQKRASFPSRIAKFALCAAVSAFYFITLRPTEARYLLVFQYNWLKGYISGMKRAAGSAFGASAMLLMLLKDKFIL